MDDKKRFIKESDEKDLKNLHYKLRNSEYRDYFHISPLTGLLNDPNGLFYFDGIYHVFYQWYPFKGLHGLKHWYEVESTDLVSFKNKGLAIRPNKKYKNRGAYSGSAFVEDNNIYIVYSGNEKDQNEKRYPNVVLAKYEEGKIKDLGVIIKPNKNYSEHQRDPRILKIEGSYYLILGARDKNDKAKIILYKSKKIDGGWRFYGELLIKNIHINAYMYECPDLLKIDDQYILLFSPQGLKKKGELYNNIYQNGYVIGDLNIDDKTFTPKSDFIELDRGFDFYAAQAFDNTDKALFIGWLGLPDTTYPNDGEFSGSLSLVREAVIKNNRLYTRPVKEILDLRYKEINFNQKIIDIEPMEINIKDIKDDFDIAIYARDKESGFNIFYKENSFSIDRSKMKNIISKDYGFIRKISDIDIKTLHIYIDKSSIEIFINDGEYALTSKVFPKKDEKNLYFNNLDENQVKLYNFKNSNEDNFVIKA